MAQERKTDGFARPGVPTPFWAEDATSLLEALGAWLEGLSSGEAAERLLREGRNRLLAARRTGSVVLLVGQFRSPITLILIGAAGLSLLLHDATNASISLGIVLASGLLGFWQERGARGTVRKLVDLVRVRATVLRGGKRQDVPTEEVVRGDVVLLSAGNAVPADCLVVESKDLFLNEAPLAGETYPVEKAPDRIGAAAALKDRTHSVFMGTHVVSGSATAIVASTGLATEVGRVSQRLRLRPPETEFERGVRRFGYLLLELTLVLLVTPLGSPFGLGRVPVLFYPGVVGIVLPCLGAAETAKRVFYRAGRPRPGR